MNSCRYLHVYSELLLAGRFLNYIRAIIELFSTLICVCISVYYTAMQMVCVLVGRLRVFGLHDVYTGGDVGAFLHNVALLKS